MLLNECIVPSSLAAFFPKEKEKLDESLLESYDYQNNSISGYQTGISPDSYQDACVWDFSLLLLIGIDKCSKWLVWYVSKWN